VLKVHLYSADANEKAVFGANPEWNYEGVAWTGYESDTGLHPVYRLYSPGLGKHLFTMDENEKNVLDAGPVWQFEMIAWYADSTPSSDDIPIYRLYSDGLKQHLFTADENEKNTLDGNGVWVYENIAFYVGVANGDGGVTQTTKWTLWSSGGTMLRGANIYQRRIYPDIDGTEFMGPGPIGPPHTQADFNNLAAMGANYVNISHPGLYSDTAPYGVDNDSQTNLDNLLSMIGKADMFAVISFRTGPGRNEFAIFPDDDWYGDKSIIINTIWTNQAAQDAWVEMWRYTAQRYKNSTVAVGYDLMVEPNSADGSLGQTEFEPADFYPTYANTLYDWNPLAVRITAGIREMDANTPVIIGGMGYSAVIWLPYLIPTGDPRTVYMVHQYEPYDIYTHQAPDGTNAYPRNYDVDYDGAADAFNKNWLNSLLATVDAFKNANNVPVSVNEFGIQRWVPGGAAFMDDIMDLFEARGMNHALWYWQPSYAPGLVENAFNFRAGPDPGNIADVQTSGLIEVIKKYWAKNTARPSNTSFPASP
jgi:hypothetical protein